MLWLQQTEQDLQINKNRGGEPPVPQNTMMSESLDPPLFTAIDT